MIYESLHIGDIGPRFLNQAPTLSITMPVYGPVGILPSKIDLHMGSSLN